MDGPGYRPGPGFRGAAAGRHPRRVPGCIADWRGGLLRALWPARARTGATRQPGGTEPAGRSLPGACSRPPSAGAVRGPGQPAGPAGTAGRADATAAGIGAGYAADASADPSPARPVRLAASAAFARKSPGPVDAGAR